MNITLRQLKGCLIIDLEGDIISLADRDTNHVYQSALDGYCDWVLLNFDKVGYLNSVGIVMMINLIVSAKKKKMNVGTFGLAPHFQKILRVVAITNHAKIFRDEAEALIGEQ